MQKMDFKKMFRVFSERGAVLDKGAIYVVVILTLLIFGGYIFVGGTLPTKIPNLNTNLVDVENFQQQPSKNSLQLYSLTAVTSTPYPTFAPIPTASPYDPNLIDCGREITGNQKPEMIWGFNFDTTAASGNVPALKVFYTNNSAMVLGTGNVSPMTKSPADSKINPAIGDVNARDNGSFPMFPSLFITDITLFPGDISGDAQEDGQANKPDFVYGSWKALATNDPAENGQVLGQGADVFPPANGPGGPHDINFSTEVVWKTSNLKAIDASQATFTDKPLVPLVPGHKYRVQIVMHDGAAKSNIGVACFKFNMPGVDQKLAGPPSANSNNTGGGNQACVGGNNLEAPPAMDAGFVLVENVCPGEPGWPTAAQVAGKDVKIILPKNRECHPASDTTPIQGTESNPVKDVWIVGGVLRGSGFSFRNYSGTIFVEGVIIDQQGQCQDGINGYFGRGDGGRWVVQNTYITGINYCNPGTHGDIVHPQGSGAMLKELKMQNVWAQTVRQGLFIVPRYNGPYPGHGVKKLTLDNVFFQTDPKFSMPGKNVATLMYWEEQGVPEQGVSFNNTYLKWWGGKDGATKSMRKDITIPNVASFDGNECTTYASGAKVTGKWCAGDPPGGNVVSLDKIGLNYNRESFCKS